MEVVELCKKYRSQNVVGIDLAGDENLENSNKEHVEAYQVLAAGPELTPIPGLRSLGCPDRARGDHQVPWFAVEAGGARSALEACMGSAGTPAQVPAALGVVALLPPQ